MIAPTQIKKPENWQDFEKLCKKLWGEIWDCSDSIKRNGRGGQNQCGADVYGKPKCESAYHGLQCKGKSDYTKNQLTPKEIDAEISKALDFKPKLKKLIFATTADKDVNIEQYIREKNLECIEKYELEIDIVSWGDIVDLLEERRDTYHWYVNNCQYKDSSDIDVYFNWGKEYEIHPQYIRTTKSYHKKLIPVLDPYLNPMRLMMEQINAPYRRIAQLGDSLRPPSYAIGVTDSILGRQKRKINHTWCTIPVNIKNTGSTVIEDYKLYIVFDPDKIEELDDKFRAFNPGPLFDQTAIVQENINRKKQQEVFESPEYADVIEYRPLNSILVQDEHRSFKIGIKPQEDVHEISVKWVILSRNYKKEGELLIKVLAQFEEKQVHIDLEEDDDPKPNETIIEPKITEE